MVSREATHTTSGDNNLAPMSQHQISERCFKKGKFQNGSDLMQ